MLIKVKGENSRWTMFDNVEQVEYDKSPRLFTSKHEIQNLVHDITPENAVFILPNIDLDELDDRNPLKATIIEFVRLQKRHLIIFSTLTYICNDEGGTVERIFGQ